MSIFDKTVSEFLQTQEQNHKCNLCGKVMEFKHQHGYFQCKKCKTKDGAGIIKAPQVLIGVGNKPIKLFWVACSNCFKTNVNDESQEPLIQVVKTKKIKIKQSSKKELDGTWASIPAHEKVVFDKIVFEKNKKQEKIICTHCKIEFVKKGKVN